MSSQKESNTVSHMPEATVGGLIFNEKDELFLMKSYKWNEKYCIPGGHIELGESMRDSIEREIKEETNLDVTDIQFHSLQDCVYSKNFHEKRHFVFLDFICKAVSDDVVLNNEASEFTWIALKDLDKFPIETYTLKSIEYFLSKNKKSPYLI